MNPAFEYIAPGNLVPSPTNPRKTFHEEKLKELADSIRAQGILQPILVRPHEGEVRQIVIGESRWRAAKLAELTQIPCIVREMTDDQVLEAQHVENLQRNDLSPLEEAESLRAMLALKTADGFPRYTVDRLAERFGVAHDHIHRRLLLLNLPPVARKALVDGVLPPSVCALIGRIPDPEQRDLAAREIIQPHDKLEPLTFAAATKLISERFMRGLKGAPFRIDDASLLPDAGPCTTCPKMTDNCAHLFTAAESREFTKRKVCCDPACYLRKVDAVYARQSATAEAEGKKVLTAAECARIYPAHQSGLAWDAPYVDIAQQPTENLLKPEVEKAPSWKSLIATAEEKTGAKVPRVIARDQAGRVHELVDRTLAIAAIEKAGEPIFRTTERGHPKAEDQYAKEKKREQEEAAKRLAICVAGLDAAFERLVDHMSFSNEDLGNVVLNLAIHHAGADGLWLIMKWRGLTADAGTYGKSDAVYNWALQQVPRWRWGLIPLLLLAPGMKWSGIENGSFRDLADSIGLDLGEVKKTGLAAHKESKKSKGKKGAKSTERPKSIPVSATDGKKLEQLVRAHEGGMSAHRLADEFGMSLEDVCGALELDVAAEKKAWDALCSELAAAWANAGIAGSFRAQDRIVKNECGLSSATLVRWPEHIRKVLAFLNRAKAGKTKQAAAAAPTEDEE